ncbi:MAG TPA: chromate transporter [Symbiobacteriaceae bacterium]|jgi:chromate transport protein ChrA
MPGDKHAAGRAQRLIAIARAGLFLGATVFGGIAMGYPEIRMLAPQVGDISVEEVDGLYALSVSFPGPSFLNLWGAVGARLGGFMGAVVGEVSLLVPGVSLVLLLPLTVRLPYIGSHTAGALQGAVWATAGLMLATGIENARKLKDWNHQAMAAAGLAALFLGLHPLLLMALMLAAGAGIGYLRTPGKEVA